MTGHPFAARGQESGKRGKRAIRRPAILACEPHRRGAHALALRFVAEETADRAGKSRDIRDAAHAARALETGKGFREVEIGGAGEKRAAEARRLERIVATRFIECAADENDVRQGVEQAEFAKRVRQVDLGGGARRKVPWRRVPSRWRNRARDGAAQ